MEKDYDAIILSPHLDDAVLSCGGTIATWTAAGKTVLVATITAGDPPDDAQDSGYIASLHERWELATNVVEQRRQEDREACAHLQADFLHWTIPDCIYRRDPHTGRLLYQSDSEIFGAVDIAETPLVATISALIEALPSSEWLLCPLTIGHHVDHQLTREAAEKSGRLLTYYEDYPYASQEGAVDKLLKSNGTWVSHVIPQKRTALQLKIEAISAYRSQLSTFFTDADDLNNQIHQFNAQTGGERFWRPSSRPFK